MQLKHFLVITSLSVFNSISAHAQVAIGANNPDASAQLEIRSSNKGLLPPRVSLTGTSDVSTISSPATGLLVYNTATISNVTPGFYYYNGSAWVRLIVPTDNASNVTGIVAVANGGTGLSSLGSGVTTFLGTPSSANLAAALTDETGSGSVVFGTSPALTTPTISSGNIQFPNSLQISPTTHATSKRGSIWIDGWSILQDVNGDGTKNFAIGQTIAGPSYPTRLFISTDGNIGVGNTSPTAKMDARTNTASATDPGDGFIGVGTTSVTSNAAGAGAIRYNTTSGGVLQYSNGGAWNTLQSNVQKSLVSGYFNTLAYANSYFGDLTATEVLDVNNDFASSTFTAPRTGYYTFTATISSDNATDVIAGGIWELQVSPSAGNKMVSRFASPATTTNYVATVTGAYTVQLTAGTTVKFQIYNSTGTTKTLAGADYNRFSIVEN